MMKKNVLITGVGGDIGQSVAKCLKEDPRFRLIGCDMDPFAGGRVLVEKFMQAPPVREAERYTAFINTILKDERIDYALPTSEAEISFIDAHKGELSSSAVFLINKSPIVRSFLDKYDTVQFLKKQGLPYPETYLLSDYRGELGFPVLLKPRKGCGGKGLAIVRNDDELNFFRSRTQDMVAQELIGNDDEYTITLFSDGNNLQFIGFKRSLGYGSLSKVAELITDPAIESLARAVANGAGLEGSLNIQCKKTSAGYVPFEINPRFSSTVYTRHCFGFKDVVWWIDLIEGRPVQYIPRFKKGVAVRVLSETFFDMA